MNLINQLYLETKTENKLRNIVKQIPCGLKTHIYKIKEGKKNMPKYYKLKHLKDGVYVVDF